MTFDNQKHVHSQENNSERPFYTGHVHAVESVCITAVKPISYSGVGTGDLWGGGMAVGSPKFGSVNYAIPN